MDAHEKAAREGRPYQFQRIEAVEPFYQKESAAEIGMSWENQVFGGRITWSGDSASDPLFVSKWPSFLTEEDPHPRRGKEKRTARKYVVPFHYVRNLHRLEFWNNVKSDDDTALYVKKTIGIEYSNEDPEATSINSSEIDWPLQDQNSARVDRERQGRQEDPSRAHANETEDERRARERP